MLKKDNGFKPYAFKKKVVDQESISVPAFDLEEYRAESANIIKLSEIGKHGAIKLSKEIKASGALGSELAILPNSFFNKNNKAKKYITRLKYYNFNQYFTIPKNTPVKHGPSYDEQNLYLVFEQLCKTPEAMWDILKVKDTEYITHNVIVDTANNLWQLVDLAVNRIEDIYDQLSDSINTITPDPFITSSKEMDKVLNTDYKLGSNFVGFLNALKQAMISKQYSNLTIECIDYIYTEFNYMYKLILFVRGYLKENIKEAK